MKLLWIVLIIVGLIAIYTVVNFIYQFNLEKPTYDVLKKTANYEIRRYNEMLIAEVDSDFAAGPGSQLNDEFMKIAGYIFGDNQVKEGEGNQKIAMTSPVLDTYQGSNDRRVSFVLPSKWSLETLPIPNNEEVTLRKTEPMVVAVKTVWGRWSEKKFKRELAKLRVALTKDDAEYTDNVSLAYYSPPSTPWFARKTEILVELKVDVAADVTDENIPESAKVATIAGGCFWCIEAPFDQMEGVYAAISGYAGGTEVEADYYKVASGQTKHREAVQVHFDPNKISYEEILNKFWQQIDPTDDGGQFADRGYHYTTAIYYADEEQKKIAQKTLDKLVTIDKFDAEIVTEILPFANFFKAEDKHQNFAQKQSAYYQRYKYGSGRGDFIEKNWKE